MSDKSVVNDSFSVFLRNVKKKDETQVPQSQNRTASFDLLKVLEKQGSLTIEKAAKGLGLTLYRTASLVHDLESTNMIAVEPNSEVVSLTDSGRAAVKLQAMTAG
jgi:predicted transcriptional regulator